MGRDVPCSRRSTAKGNSMTLNDEQRERYALLGWSRHDRQRMVLWGSLHEESRQEYMAFAEAVIAAWEADQAKTTAAVERVVEAARDTGTRQVTSD